MSNRDGRTAKHSKVTFRKGQLCPSCKKGHLQSLKCHHPGHKHLCCNVCHWTDF